STTRRVPPPLLPPGLCKLFCLWIGSAWNGCRNKYATVLNCSPSDSGISGAQQGEQAESAASTTSPGNFRTRTPASACTLARKMIQYPMPPGGQVRLVSLFVHTWKERVWLLLLHRLQTMSPSRRRNF